MCETARNADAILLWAKPHCEGSHTQISESGQYGLAQEIGSFVIPPHFHVSLHSRAHGQLDYDAKLWGDVVEETALTLDRWDNDEHFALSETQWLTVRKRSPEELAHSCVGWSEALAGYEPSAQRCRAFLDQWCARADAYGSELCLHRPWVSAEVEAPMSSTCVWLACLVAALVVLAALLAYRVVARRRIGRPLEFI